MKLNYLKLQNFASIIDSEVYFDNDMNLIHADNGQGKSFLQEAISLLLYNTTRDKIEDYINWDSTFFKIELEGELDNHIFNISFYYDKKDNERILNYKNELYKNSDAVKKLDELLDKQVALNSSVISQGSIDIINSKASERRELLKKLYDVNYQSAIDDIKVQIENKNNLIIDLDKKIYLLDNKKYQEKEVIIFSDNTKELHNQLKDIDNKIDIIKKDNENILIIKKQKEDIEKNIKDKNNQIETTNLNIIQESKNIEEINEEKNNKNYNDLIKVQQDNYDQLLLKNFNDEELEINNISLKRLLPPDENKLKDLTNNYYCVKSDITNIEKNINLLKAGKCPICNKDCSLKDLEFFNKELNDKNTLLVSLNKEITIVQNEKVQYDNDDKENKKLLDKKNSLVKDLEYKKKEHQLNINNLKNKIESLKQEKINKESDWIKQIDRISKSTDLLKNNLSILNNEKNKLDSDLLDINNKLNNVIDNTDLEKSLIQQKKDIEEKINIINKNIILNQEIENHNKNLKIEKEKDIVEVKKFYSQKDIINKEVSDLEKCKDIFSKEFPNYIITKTIKGIENNMNIFLRETYDNRYQVKIKESKNSISIVYGKRNSDIIMGSGYERQIFNIAFKSAISKIAKINYPVLLDEIDSYASEKNSVIFYNFLGNLLRNKKQQSFIITHKESTKNYLITNFNPKIITIENGKIL